MTLTLYKKANYVYPYNTNRNYLHNMTSLQVKPIEEMEWNEDSKHIEEDLWIVPWNSFTEWNVERAAKHFIERLNDKIMGL
jgi:hypothetical protein